MSEWSWFQWGSQIILGIIISVYLYFREQKGDKRQKELIEGMNRILLEQTERQSETLQILKDMPNIYRREDAEMIIGYPIRTVGGILINDINIPEQYLDFAQIFLGGHTVIRGKIPEESEYLMVKLATLKEEKEISYKHTNQRTYFAEIETIDIEERTIGEKKFYLFNIELRIFEWKNKNLMFRNKLKKDIEYDRKIFFTATLWLLELLFISLA